MDPHLTIEYATRTVNRAKRKAAAAEEDDVEMEEDEGPTGPLKKCRRPAGGEMSFWSTGITLEAEPNRDRQDAYGWNDVGGEPAVHNADVGGIDSRRNKRDHIRPGSDGEESYLEPVRD